MNYMFFKPGGIVDPYRPFEHICSEKLKKGDTGDSKRHYERVHDVCLNPMKS
jgi:hypothetical protein